VLPQEAHVARLDRPAALDRPVDDWHRNLHAGAADHLADALARDAVERVREFVRVAFAADFPVRDDVDARALLLADRDDGRVVLRLSSRSGGTRQISRARTRGAIIFVSSARSTSQSGCG
jgi:hypothetical protein